MEKDLILTKEDLHRLNLVLTRLIDKARIDCVIIINKSGRMITSQSESSEFDKTSLAALISGNFASSSSIANMLDEHEFNSMLQEGQNKHIYVCQVDYNTILASIFDKRTTVEKVKVCIEESSGSLREYLKMVYSHVVSDPSINLDVAPMPQTFTTQHSGR